MLSIIMLLILSVWDMRSRKVPIWLLTAEGLVLLMTKMYIIFGFEYDVKILFLEFLNLIMAIIPGLCFIVLSFITRQQVGYADGCTLILLGIYEPIGKVMEILCLGVFISALIGIFLMMIKKADKTTRLPFIPCLFLASVLRFFCL